MVKFINRFTGNEMWVSEQRIEEYEKAGHKRKAEPKPTIASSSKPAKKPETKKKR